MTIYSGHGDGTPSKRSPSPLPQLAWSWSTSWADPIRQRIGRCEVSKAANSYWVDERIRTQRITPRTNSLASVQQISIDILGTRTEVRRRGGIIPSWVVFGMILLATSAVCVTVNMRTHAKFQVAQQQFSVMQSDVETLRTI